MKDINYNCVLFRMILSLLVVMTWENALGETYSIDFESKTDAYTDWTFTNMTSQQTNSNVNVYGGSYIGTTGGKSTASIVTTAIICCPQSITFYVSKASDNTTESTWAVQVSKDNITWTDVKTQSATSMTKGTWTKVTQVLSSYKNVYVRIYYSGSTAVRVIDDLTLEYESLTSISISGTPSNTTYYDGDSFDPSGLKITATYNDNSTATITDGITWNFDPAKLTVGTTSCEVTATVDKVKSDAYKVSGLTVIEKVKHTISWSVNGSITTEEKTLGDDITFSKPQSPDDGFAFIGWTTGAIDGLSSEVPSMINSAKVSADVTYYAVFARITDSGQVCWSKITNVDEVTNGVYALIRNDGLTYLPNTTSSTNPVENAVTSTNKLIDVKDDMKWNLTISDNIVTLVSSVDNTSLVWGGYSNDEIRVSTNSYATYKTKDWYAELSETFGVILYCMVKNNKMYLSAYGDNYWKTYQESSLSATGSSTHLPANLYKLVDGVTYSDYCTTLPNTLTITLNAACHDTEGRVYGTYSSSKAFVVPEELTVAEVGVNSDGAIDVKSYNTGDVVAGNTGVMISADKGGSYVVEEAASNSSVATVLGNANCLKPSCDSGITSTEMSTAASNCTYYRLTMHNGTQIGYWWGAEDGGAFDLAANKAYLAVPKSQSVKVNLWLSDIVTSIDATRKKKSNDAMYNLVGQRVNDAVKGIYIKNGKKYMMK